jgi:NitT/TauT family transport system permease protein
VSSRRVTTERLISVVTPLVLLGIWEIVVQVRLLDSRLFPAPSSVAGEFVKLIEAGDLLTSVLTSISRLVIGFAMGAIPAIVLGVIMGLSRLVRAAINPIVGVTYPIPKIAILPLVMVIFGLDEMSKYVIIAITVFYIVLINTAAGVMNIDNIYLDVGRTFGASRLDAFRTIALPGSLPFIFAGIRLGWGIGLLALVAAEFVGASSGLGYLVWQSWLIFSVAKMFVGIVAISLLGWASFVILDEIERVLIPWKAAGRSY